MRYCGKIGYAMTVKVEDEPGVWTNTIVERKYFGDITRQIRRWDTVADNTNDNVNVNNLLSIVADPFAMDNYQFIRYAEMHNTKWKVTSVEVQYPRLILTLGGVWNG